MRTPSSPLSSPLSRALLTLLAPLLLLAGPAHAQESGWSLALGVSFSAENFDADEGLDADGLDLDADDSSSLSAQLGYRLNDYLSFEVEYERLDDFDLGNTLDLSAGLPAGSLIADLDGEVDGYLVSLNAKVYPLRTRLRPYIMGGVGLMKLDASVDALVSANVPGLGPISAAGEILDEDETAAVFQVGLGFDLAVTDRWTIEVEGSYKLPESDLEDFEFYTLGGMVRYNF